MIDTPCTWPADYSSCGGSCSALDGLSEEERAKFEQMAAELLWSWTNRVFGVCEVAARPCREKCIGPGMTSTFWGDGPFPMRGSMQGGTGWVPVLISGGWYNMGCGCLQACQCDVVGPSSLQLPGPIDQIGQVRINGDILDPAAYTVMYNRYLVRVDGDVWPACQDLMKPATEDNTFEVQYTQGIPVPVGGQLATGKLACELAKAYCNDGTCELPQRIQTVTREGVSVTMMDSFEDLKAGGTGIWAIDAWTAAVNTPRSYGAVRSVDINPRRGTQLTRR